MIETTEHQPDDAEPSDEHLAELERAWERGENSVTNLVENSLTSEHQHNYSLVEQLCSPIRWALHGDGVPPSIPEYGELTEIGRGGMGIVYRGKHRITNRIDAIKIIRPDRIPEDNKEHLRMMRQLFRQESQLAARVAHEHIVPVYQVGK